MFCLYQSSNFTAVECFYYSLAQLAAVGNLQCPTALTLHSCLFCLFLFTFLSLSLCLSRVSLTPQRSLCSKSDEVKLAQEASKRYGSPGPTIFSKVIDKSLPAEIIYEDDKVNNQMLQNRLIFMSRLVHHIWTIEEIMILLLDLIPKCVFCVFTSVWRSETSTRRPPFTSWLFQESLFLELVQPKMMMFRYFALCETEWIYPRVVDKMSFKTSHSSIYIKC